MTTREDRAPGGFTRPGDLLPEIELPDLEGHAHSLTTYRNRKLLIFLWASW